ncbi:MAG TPA: hypothetical protein VIJ93_07300, partial [bacterium]
MEGSEFKPVFSETNLRQGLEALNTLWEAGNTPEQIRAHFLLTWFALFDGNITKAKEIIGIHRNSFANNIKDLTNGIEVLRLRDMFRAKQELNYEKPFHDQFFFFWLELGLEPKLNDVLNANLIELWKTGFPQKILDPSLILWAHRNKKDRPWIFQQLGITHRNTFLWHIENCLNPSSKTDYWLAPLKPTLEDWKQKVPQGRPRKRPLQAKAK